MHFLIPLLLLIVSPAIAQQLPSPHFKQLHIDQTLTVDGTLTAAALDSDQVGNISDIAHFAATNNYHPRDATDAVLFAILGSDGHSSGTNNAIVVAQKWGGNDASPGLNPTVYFSHIKTSALPDIQGQALFAECKDNAGWNGSGGNNFMECGRFHAILAAGTHLGSAYAINAVAGEDATGGTTHKYMVGIDSDLYNFSTNATVNFSANGFEAAYVAESSGTKKVSAGFIINPYLGQTNTDDARFIDGFYVPEGVGDVASPIDNSAFRSDAASLWGMDLTRATNFGAIGIAYNTPIRGMRQDFEDGSLTMLATTGADLISVCGDPDASECRLGSPNVTTLAEGSLATDGMFYIKTSQVPANAASTCSVGQLSWGASFLYACVATNTWKRAAIATW